MDSGTQITFTYKGKDLEGVLIKETSGASGELTIKLDSGYNLVAPKKEVKIMKKTPPKKVVKKKAAAPKPKKGLPKITILHTGGTVASKVDYETGAVVAKFSPEELLDLFPELADIASVKKSTRQQYDE